MTPSADPLAFIRANTRLRPVPHAPEIVLHVADEATELWQKTEDELAAIGLPPPFWAFAWAGGQALARYILDNPGLVAGPPGARFRLRLGPRRHRGGAGRRGACHGERPRPLRDRRPSASTRRPTGWRSASRRCRATSSAPIRASAVVLAADIFYERDLAPASPPGCPACTRRGATVLVGDPGRSYLPRDRLTELATYDGAGEPLPGGCRDQAQQRLALQRLSRAPRGGRLRTGRGAARRGSTGRRRRRPGRGRRSRTGSRHRRR